MATVKGREGLRQFMANAPVAIEKILRGAARAAAEVVADEAKDRCISSDVRQAIKVSTRKDDAGVAALVQVKGRGAFIAPWLEYGTAPHFISVSDSQREGLSVRKVNDQTKAGSLVIGGQFVGGTVHHPGARPHPFLRPALDIKQTEAVAAARHYITARISRTGIRDGGEGGEG